MRLALPLLQPSPDARRSPRITATEKIIQAIKGVEFGTTRRASRRILTGVCSSRERARTSPEFTFFVTLRNNTVDDFRKLTESRLQVSLMGACAQVVGFGKQWCCSVQNSGLFGGYILPPLLNLPRVLPLRSLDLPLFNL
jgi:hypothetical protein